MTREEQYAARLVVAQQELLRAVIEKAAEGDVWARRALTQYDNTRGRV